MSSRNRHLSAEERQLAPSIHQALLRVSTRIAEGVTDSKQVSREAIAELERKGLRVEYLEIVDPDSIQPVERIAGPVLVACAVWLGATRLIDNVVCAPAS
jgi:pantoate--beta-alanine ligase